MEPMTATDETVWFQYAPVIPVTLIVMFLIQLRWKNAFSLGLDLSQNKGTSREEVNENTSDQADMRETETPANGQHTASSTAKITLASLEMVTLQAKVKNLEMQLRARETQDRELTIDLAARDRAKVKRLEKELSCERTKAKHLASDLSAVKEDRERRLKRRVEALKLSHANQLQRELSRDRAEAQRLLDDSLADNDAATRRLEKDIRALETKSDLLAKAQIKIIDLKDGLRDEKAKAQEAASGPLAGDKAKPESRTQEPEAKVQEEAEDAGSLAEQNAGLGERIARMQEEAGATQKKLETAQSYLRKILEDDQRSKATVSGAKDEAPSNQGRASEKCQDLVDEIETSRRSYAEMYRWAEVMQGMEDQLRADNAELTVKVKELEDRTPSEVNARIKELETELANATRLLNEYMDQREEFGHEHQGSIEQ